MRICFVCLGNICRSPTAEGILRHLLKDRPDVVLESAGIADYHVGERPDARTIKAAAKRGVSLESRARFFIEQHLDEYDLVLALDETHLKHLKKLAGSKERKAKLHLLREFDPLANGDLNVPDPYYGNAQGFDDVFEMCWRACENLAKQI